MPSLRGIHVAAAAAYTRVYNRLVAIAESWARRSGGRRGSLEPEALVHETWLRLAPQSVTCPDNSSHLLALATREMRRVQIDHARAAHAQKRGGNRRQLSLSGDFSVHRLPDEQLEHATLLERIAEHNARWSRMVDLRWGKGLSVEEAARELGVSAATVEKDSTKLRVWLSQELQRSR